MSQAIETLVKERNKLLLRKEEMLTEIHKQISEVEAAIEKLSGKHVWEIEQEYVYDDESPDYIRQSIEEI